MNWDTESVSLKIESQKIELDREGHKAEEVGHYVT